MTAKARTKKSAAISSEDFEHDAIMLRTTDAVGKSYNDFQWPLTEGAIVTCPDWNPEPVCGGGLHGLLDGLGDYELLNSDRPDRKWWIVGVKRDECVAIDNDKVKVPRAKVLYFGGIAGALSRIPKPMVEAIQTKVKSETSSAEASKTTKATTGDNSAAATTGDNSAAATTGNNSAAATTGDYSAAATTGDNSAAATTGDNSAAATTGKDSIAAALGPNAKAKAGPQGWITLAAWELNNTTYEYKLRNVRSAKVGTEGIEPGIYYRLTPEGQFVKADE